MTSRGKVIVITGASAGVGRATVREFARNGCRIALLARGRAGLDAAKREVEELGGEALVLPTDVSDAQAVENAAERVERELGPIEIWVNNAMVSVFSPVKEMMADEYRRVTEVTYLGYVHGTLSALRRMLPRDRGVIIQVGSALAYRSIPLQSAYCAAKHAIAGFSESLRCELLHDQSKVQVVQVQLPAMNTPQFGWVRSRLPHSPRPVAPIFQPEVAARAIVWAARFPHRAGREVQVGGPTVSAILAEKFVPSLTDRILARRGYRMQQSNVPVSTHRPDNLWEALPGDAGAHGTFGAIAKGFSLEFFLRKHALKFACSGVLGGVFLLVTSRAKSLSSSDADRRHKEKYLSSA